MIQFCSFLEWFIFSRSIEFRYLMNCFKYLLVSSLLLTGQLPTLSTLIFRVSLSFFSLLHWNIRWSILCVPCCTWYWKLHVKWHCMFRSLVRISIQCGWSPFVNVISCIGASSLLNIHFKYPHLCLGLASGLFPSSLSNKTDISGLI
jgi:hypothetical protein